MRVFCEGADLCGAVLIAVKATSNKTTNPILEGIKITASDNVLTFVATDGELAIEKKINADVKIEGEIVVPGKLFAEFVKKLDGEQISLSLTSNNQLKIKYTDSEMFIQCQSADEFPSIHEIDNAQFFQIKQKDLKDVIDKTIFSTAQDDTRPILKGCLFEVDGKNLTSIALDGYRLAIAKKPIKECSSTTSIIVPARSLSEISKLLSGDLDEDIRVLVQRNYIMIQVGNAKIISRCLGSGEDFINYKQIIPDIFKSEVIVSKRQLLDALERASILARVGNNNSVNLNINGNILTVTANSEAGNVTENVTVSIKGEDVTISFNTTFFMDCLKNITDEFVVLKLNGSINPCFIIPNEGDGYMFLVSPIRPSSI